MKIKYDYRTARARLRSLVDPKRARVSQSFFKTGRGQYGEGDLFIGVSVPDIRRVAKLYAGLPLLGLRQLLKSKVHEDRLLALIILVNQFKKAGLTERAKLHKFYVANLVRVNNWDLVDSSAPYLIGIHLRDKPRKLLDKLVKSKNLWERRIAMVATSAFIGRNDFTYVHKLASRLVPDKHDLIHKASGWMLREMGKRNERELIRFLNKHAIIMPRTMLRYAIERLTPNQKTYYLSLKNMKNHSKVGKKAGRPTYRTPAVYKIRRAENLKRVNRGGRAK